MRSRLAPIAAAVFVCLSLVGASVGAAVSVGPAAPDAPAPGAAVASALDVPSPTATGSVSPTAAAAQTNGTSPNGTDGDGDGDTLAEPVPVIDHEDPRVALGRGSVRSIGSYLVGSMSNRLLRSARLIDDGEYTEARAMLGPEYDSLYERYDDVRGDLGTGQTAAERFAVVRDEQFAYATAIQDYRLVREDYLEARRDADSFRSRKLAREMEQQAENVTAHRDNLVANYTLMTEMSDDRRNETIRLVNQQAAAVTALQSTVREQQFVDTRLRVQVPNTSGSFAYPYRLFATVTTLDGAPLANESGQLTVGTQRYAVETDENGTFAVDYRPATVPSGATTVEARFFVDEQSAYLGDRTTVDLFVRQETPTITASANPATVRFGQDLVVSGDVGATVPNATRLVARTDDINLYQDRLRAAIEAAARTAAAANESAPTAAQVTVDLSDLSTASADASAGAGASTGDTQRVTLTVDVAALTTVTGAGADPANVTVESDEAAIESIPLPAALRTPLRTEYVGAGNVTLVVAVGDLRLGTVETGADGRFSSVTPLPLDARNGSQPIRVALVEPNRALAPATATTTVTVQSTSTRTTLDEVTTRGRELLLTGTLTTAAGAPLSNQPVEVRLDGTVVETARTADDGTFGVSLSLPERDEAGATVRVVAGFTAPTTNLGASRSAASVVTLPEPRSAVAEEVPVVTRLRESLGIGEVVVVLPVVDFGISAGLVAGVVGVSVLAVGVLLVARRRRTGPVTTAGRRHLDDVSSTGLLEAGRPDPTDVADTTPPRVYLQAAREALADSNPRLATEYAYVAVRRHLSADTTLPVRVTHREFLRAVRDRGDDAGDDAADVVDALTTVYERAAFSPQRISTDDAEQAISAAERMVS